MSCYCPGAGGIQTGVGLGLIRGWGLVTQSHWEAARIGLYGYTDISLQHLINGAPSELDFFPENIIDLVHQ